MSIVGILSQVLIPGEFVGLGDIVDAGFIPGVIDTTVLFTFGTATIGGFTERVVISAEDACFFPEVNSEDTGTLPSNADPPFPPVWPYLFSTNDIYGRDHLSVNLKMIRGDTFAFDIAVILNGAAVDITGGALTMTAKWAVGDTDATAVFQLSSATTGIVVTNATGGLATVTISPVNTVGLPAYTVTLAYDIQLESAASNIYTVLRGNLLVFPDVTITT